MVSNVSGGPYSRRWRGKGKGKGGGGKWKAAGWAMSDDAYEQLDRKALVDGLQFMVALADIEPILGQYKQA